MDKLIESILFYFLFPLMAGICYTNLEMLNNINLPLGNTIIIIAFFVMMISYCFKIFRNKEKSNK